MMEIYEVLNQVHSEEEYMEFPEMETAACIRRVRTKLHDNRKKHVMADNCGGSDWRSGIIRGNCLRKLRRLAR